MIPKKKTKGPQFKTEIKDSQFLLPMDLPVDHPNFKKVPLTHRSTYSLTTGNRSFFEVEEPVAVGPRSTKADNWVELRNQIARFIERWGRPYQLRWLRDRSKQKAANWCRRAGKSQTLSLESDLQALEPPKTSDYTVTMISSGKRPANELLLKAIRWSNVFNDIALKVVGQSIYYKPPASEVIWFWNGNRILSLPANPETAAGFTGDVLWDEVAKTPRDELIFEAVHPNITTHPSFTMRMASTPFGDRGVFPDVMLGRKKGWSLHTIDLPLAIKEGDPRNLEWVKSQYSSFVFRTNYLCLFESSSSQAFSPTVITQAIEVYDNLPRIPRPENVPAGHFRPRIAIGVDIGRRHDMTSFVWVVEYPKGCYRATKVTPLENTPFKDQEDLARTFLLDPNVEAMVIDETGIGMHLAENLKTDFPAKVQPVMFNNTIKNTMMSNVIGLMERGKVGIVDDERLTGDFASIHQTILPSAQIKYDASRNERGHADSFTAFALALLYLSNFGAEWNISMFDDLGKEMIEAHDYGLNIISALPQSPTNVRIPVAEDLGAIRITDDDLRRLNAAKGNRLEQQQIMLELGMLEGDDYFG